MVPTLITEKLREELRQEIRSERQIVYILVQIRKLLESAGEKTQYPTLLFYCDWATHSEMSRDSAKRLLRRFNEWQQLSHQIIYQQADRKATLDEAFIKEMRDLTGLTRLKQELTSFLRARDIENVLVEDKCQWANFVKYCCDTITGCPLRCSDPTLEYVDEIFVNFLDLAPEQMKDATVVIRWSWVAKKTGNESRTYSFF
jgi:hypothetical protein